MPATQPAAPAHETTPHLSARVIPQKPREIPQFPVEEHSQVACDAHSVERSAHAPHPSDCHRVVNGDGRVAHSKPWVPVLSDVVLRPTEPTDEEKGEPISRLASHTATGIARVQTSQCWLELGHRIVKVLDERPHRRLASKAVKWTVSRGGDVRHDARS
jgi:hypothetical protein